ncbi:development-specific protein LVN1.2-like [Diadema setosum]|uniref:development-specific protein LVN1.2-like n=1 Tax=Diadema setosum TaxID=31175 RepID=UPI003B3B2E99
MLICHSLKMKLFAITTLVVAVSSANAQSACCAPLQYMAGIGTSMGQYEYFKGGSGLSSYIYGAFDFSAMTFGFGMYIDYLNGTQIYFRIIQNYTTDTQWAIFDSYKVCVKQPAFKPVPNRCIPDGAVPVGDGVIGGVDGIMVSSFYYFPGPDDPRQGIVNLGVRKTNNSGICTPVSSQFQGSRSDMPLVAGMMEISGFSNVTVGIPDPGKWFNLPSFCNEDSHTSSKSGQELPDFGEFIIPSLF